MGTAIPYQASTPDAHNSPACVSIRIVPPDGIRPFSFHLPLSTLGEQVLALTCERTKLPADAIWISLHSKPILMALSLRDLGAQDASVLQVSVRAAGGTRPKLLPSQWDTPGGRYATIDSPPKGCDVPVIWWRQIAHHAGVHAVVANEVEKEAKALHEAAISNLPGFPFKRTTSGTGGVHDALDYLEELERKEAPPDPSAKMPADHDANEPALTPSALRVHCRERSGRSSTAATTVIEPAA